MTTNISDETQTGGDKMKNGKIAQKKAKARIGVYIPEYMDKAAIQFMARDENIDTYRKGKMSLLVTNALKAYMGIE